MNIDARNDANQRNKLETLFWCFFSLVYILSLSSKKVSWGAFDKVLHLLQVIGGVLLPLLASTWIFVGSLGLLVLTQLPSALTSKNWRIIVGLASSTILGSGVLLLRGVVPLFATVLATIASLPRHRRHAFVYVPIALAILHLTRGLYECLVDTTVTCAQVYTLSSNKVVVYIPKYIMLRK